jgi:RNA polymerase sigma factor (sigma-70 family)
MKRIESIPHGAIPFGTLSSRGDPTLGGFEKLAMPLSHSLYNFARWLARNGHEADDLVQETYLKALRSFASFEPGTNFRAWMFRILKNTFLTSCSKNEQRMTIPLDSEENFWAQPATFDTPESLLIEHFDIDAIQNAIEQLPVIYREVILLSDVENASYREIVEILSIPIGTVMSRLARARKIVRESLRSNSCPPLARDLAHLVEPHEKVTVVAEAAKRTTGYERRAHRSELPSRRTQASA